MNKNNKKKSSFKIISISLIFILCFFWILYSNDMLSSSDSNSLGMFKQKNSSAVNDTVPSLLRWNDSFKKDNNQSRGSYLKYLAEKNKK